ncbi:MAG: hypothetical protein FWF01_00260 [Alphaproteobacteria bacterium]|nr:hypothetical protein [Alphaproteobacteria bacterium]
MIWKFWFVFYLAVWLLISTFGAASPQTQAIATTNSIIMTGVLISAAWVVLLGYFYALGWKKRLYPEKFHRVFGLALVLVLAAVVVTGSIYMSYDALSSRRPPAGEMLVVTIVVMVVLTAMLAAVLSPVIVALLRYRKRQHHLAPVDSAFWKLVALYAVLNFVTVTAMAFTVYLGNLTAYYNGWDIFLISSGAYPLIFLTGLAYKRKFFNQLFWKISGVFYVAGSPVAAYFSSRQFRTDFEIHFDLWAYNALVVFIAALYIYALYKYAFTNVVFGKADVKKVGKKNPRKKRV